MARFGGRGGVLAALGAAAVASAALLAPGEAPETRAATEVTEAPAGPTCRVVRPAAESRGEEAAMSAMEVRAAAIPPIDAAAPARTERATFALG